MKDSSKLQRFNSTVNNFEQEVDRLKAATKAYQKLEELSTTYRLILDQFEENSKNIKTLAEEHENRHQAVVNSITQMRTANEAHQNKVTQAISEGQRAISDSIDAQVRANRQFYTDFERVVRIKLDENKSEIRRLIEQDRAQMKQYFDDKLDQYSASVTKQYSQVKTIALVFGILNLVILIGILVKLFV